MIVGVFPELLKIGGVQRICNHTAAVMWDYAQRNGADCELISFNDPQGSHEAEVAGIRFPFTGCGRSKRHLVASALKRCRKARFAYFGHPFHSSIGLMMKRINPRMRYWIATYGIDVWEPLPGLRKRGMLGADGITILSRFTGDLMVKAGNSRPDTTIGFLPPALDPEFVELDGRDDLECRDLPSGKILLTVARLATTEQRKGMETVIEVLPRILEKHPDTYYVLVGDGDGKAGLEKLARDRGVSDHVLFPGAKRGLDLVRYYNSCDAFVMPSAKEGFGIVFVEAMVFSKPTIGGDTGGTPEVIVDQETGYLVTYGDLDALTDRILRLLDDPETANRMGEAGRRRVEENYTFEVFQKRFEKLMSDELEMAQAKPVHR